MPGFFERDGVKFANYTTGPRHVRIGLRFSEVPTGTELVELPPIGTCNHGTWDLDRLRAAVFEGLAEASDRHDLTFHVSEIHYAPNDTPVYGFAAVCAYRICECIANGGEFR